jgi:CRISPR-associated protein Cmr3
VSVWLIEPRDPLVARDGRPATIGGALRTVGFPFPSAVAGAVRTRLAGGAGSFALTAGEIAELLAIEVSGPLLAELAAEGDQVSAWFAPAPGDAQLAAAANGSCSLRRLRPGPLAAGQAVDALGELLPVAADGSPVDVKPPLDPPAFWRWEAFETWLAEPRDRPAVAREDLGLPALLREHRSHVAIQPGERVGLDGMLFSTLGLRFLAGAGEARLSPRRLALAVRCAGGAVSGRRLALAPALAPLGGERRLARWRPADPGWPHLPPAVRDRVRSSGRARLILLTPALFSGGSLPGWSGRGWWDEVAVHATVRAACVGRPEVVSGWDLAADNGPGKPKGRPKPTRRLAPAGSVYFVELDGEPEDRARWCEAVWLRPVSDGVQDRRDGFGLAAVGTWE